MGFLEKMKAIQNHILVFLDSEEEDKENYDDLVKLTFQQSQLTIQECKSILNLISRITLHHHRSPLFFDKIKNIFFNLKKEIKDLLSNTEIFNIFKNNLLVLLLLIDDEILIFDSNILSAIEETKIKDYFYLEINKFHQNSNFIEIPEYYDEKRRYGENDTYLCELIRNDDIENFTIYYTRSQFSLSRTIESSIYETNLFLIYKNPTLIEYSAFFGSMKIFRFLFQNQVELTQSLWIYSIHGRNPDMIHFLEENEIYPKDKTYQECLKESIKYHHNDFALYFKDNFINDVDIHDHYHNNEIYYGFQFYNFQFIPSELNNKFGFYYAVEYDHYKLVEYYKNIEGFNINESIILNMNIFNTIFIMKKNL